MKNYLKNLLIDLCIIVLIFAMAVGAATGLSSLTGCSTPADRVALNAAGIQVLTVDAGMKAFSAQANAGRVTQAQLDAVRSAYPIYYQTALIEKRAFNAYAAVKTVDNANALQSAIAAAIASEADIIKLLNLALPKTVVVAAKPRTL